MGFGTRLAAALCGVLLAASATGFEAKAEGFRSNAQFGKAVAASGQPSAGASGRVVAANTGTLRVVALERDDLKASVARTSAVRKTTKGRIWCVPFAREASGINIRGNATTWWHKAESLYPKGKQPVIGAVLNFRSTKKMPMGHVAVVSKVVSPRKILVDHANWLRNRVSLDMAVIDVSPRNDWSQVRVETVPNTPGSVYPTYGFIYRAAANG